MIAELQYLGRCLILVLAFVATLVAALLIGLSAEPNLVISAILSMVAFVVIGLCGSVAYALLNDRGTRTVAAGERVSRPPARFGPFIVSLIPPAFAAYSVILTCVAVHQGERVSTGALIAAGAAAVAFGLKGRRAMRKRPAGARRIEHTASAGYRNAAVGHTRRLSRRAGRPSKHARGEYLARARLWR